MHEPSFLETADHIGARLCRDAIWSGDRCNWLGWGLEVVGNAWTPVFRAQSGTLYDGTAGIALFLGRLYSLTGDPLEKMTALGALNHALDVAGEIAPELQPSLYSGAMGIGYVMLQLGAIFADDGLAARGLALMRKASEVPANSVFLDILGGSAGTIQGLLETAHRFDALDLLERADAHGKLLIQSVAKSDRGWSWNTLPGQAGKNLLGYGHGAGGIACALLELWAETTNPDCREAALEAFRYERSYFCSDRHNWPDLRSMAEYGVPSDQAVYAVAWCHGGPGIGLSRLRAFELLEDAECLRDLDEACHLTAEACRNPAFPASGNLCLCHGLGGNADLLLAADGVQRGRGLRQIAESIGHQAIAQLRSNDLPWPCGVNGAGETPNLMLGLAGIGYFFLRLYDSVQIPSVLLVRPTDRHASESGVEQNMSPVPGLAEP
jgi:lantibiotic biosynthesis protein